MKRLFLWTAGLIVLGVAVAAAYAFTRSSAAGAAGAGSARATTQPMEVLVKSQGLTVAATTIEVKSRASGYVQAVHARAGDRVKKDQILVNNTPYTSVQQEQTPEEPAQQWKRGRAGAQIT